MEEVQKLAAYVKEEIRTRREQGCDTWEMEREAQLLEDCGPQEQLTHLKSLVELLERLEPTEEFSYHEPSDLPGIHEARPEGPRSLGVGLAEEVLRQKTLGGWTGRVAGCMLGKPVEGWDRQQIRDLLELCEEYPLEDYVPPPASKDERAGLSEEELELRRGHITRGVRDDDTDYSIIGLRAMERHGKAFQPADIARFWLQHLPYECTYTAERAAYRNFVNEIWPPGSATWRNPYREWIGAQIRADAWGWASPGRPQEAAELAFRDASISHTRNGIYGEMWVAAMLAAAFVADDAEQVVRMGLSEIPHNCRLSEAIGKVLAWWHEDESADATLSRILEHYEPYHKVHTINNAAIVATALLWGEKDFTRSIGLAVMAGLDTDCNGATVGSVVGVMIGEPNIPVHWKDPLNDRLESVVCGDTRVRISDLAARTLPLQKMRVGE